MMKKIFFFTTLLIFSYGCRSSKNVTESKKEIQKDTVIITKTIKEVERFTDTLTIKQPCDSLGNLKPFLQTINVPQGKYTLKGVNNVITANLDLKGYKDVLEKEYQSKYKELEDKRSEVRIKYQTPFKFWIYLILSLLLNFALIYLIIKK